MALSDAKIRKAKPGEKSPIKLVDGGGLYVWIAPQSGAKSWRFDYRLFGKRKTLTIGRYPEITLAEARAAHLAARSLVEKNIDPAQRKRAESQKQAISSNNTFEVVARDFFAKKRSKGDVARRWTDGYATKVTRMFERDVFPKVGAIHISEVTAAELSPILEAVAERTKIRLPGHKKVRTRPRGAAATAVHIRQLCSAIFGHAASKGLARYDFDPTWGLRGVVAKPATQHAKYLHLDEFPALWEALAAAAASERAKIAIELLALTFVRTGELRLVQRSELQLEGVRPLWSIPAEKMKMRRPHLVPLGPRAVELFRRLIALADEEAMWLFPSRTDPASPMNPNTINQILYRMGYAGRLSGHGFRGTASTALHERGFPPHVVEAQLAHAGKDKVAASYNHAIYLQERTEMLRTWEQMVHADNTNILPFKKVSGGP
jgi:integrase